MDWRHVPELVEAAEAARLDYLNQLVWAKTNAACATRDLPDGAGGTILAKDVHRTALAELADAFATVVRDAAVWQS